MNPSIRIWIGCLMKLKIVNMKDLLKYFLEEMYKVSKIPKSFMNKESNSDSDRKLSELIERLRK